jgi:hypothetical protein
MKQCSPALQTDHSLQPNISGFPMSELSGAVMTIGFDSHLISRQISPKNPKLLKSSIHLSSERYDFETIIMFVFIGQTVVFKMNHGH